MTHESTSETSPSEIDSPPKIDLFKDIIPSLTYTKVHLFEAGVIADKDYPSIIVNKNFSYSAETIFLANAINKLGFSVTPRQNYDFWFHVLEPKKRFEKWVKVKDPEFLDDIKEYYKCSEQKAKQFLKVLTLDQINILRKRLGKENPS